jgi:hypothetical protein
LNFNETDPLIYLSIPNGLYQAQILVAPIKHCAREKIGCHGVRNPFPSVNVEKNCEHERNKQNYHKYCLPPFCRRIHLERLLAHRANTVRREQTLVFDLAQIDRRTAVRTGRHLRSA